MEFPAAALVRLRVAGFELFGDVGPLARRGGEGCAGGEAAVPGEPTGAAVFEEGMTGKTRHRLGDPPDRHPDFGTFAELDAFEGCGNHTGDRYGESVELDDGTQDVRIAGELAMPEGFADQGYRLAIVLGVEQ